jgi:hypothetical protein
MLDQAVDARTRTVATALRRLRAELVWAQQPKATSADSGHDPLALQVWQTRPVISRLVPNEFRAERATRVAPRLHEGAA